jgi:hypothetical protein
MIEMVLVAIKEGQIIDSPNGDQNPFMVINDSILNGEM